MRKHHLAISFLLVLMASTAAPATRLVPVFVEALPGAGGSVWQSELRFFNASSTTQILRVAELMRYGDTSCMGFSPIEIPPGALRQVRSIGCDAPGAAALEITADSAVAISSVITNIGSGPQDACCPAGYATAVPVVDRDHAYAAERTLHNLQIPVIGVTSLGRHNVGVVNPNSFPITVRLHYFTAEGIPDAVAHWPTQLVVPAKALLQANDILRQLDLPITNPIFRGYWRIQATADAPFYIYDSYVDNTTHDATFTSGW